MPSKSKPKITLAQRLSGIQQIIWAELRSTQNRLLASIESGDVTAMQAILEQFQRIIQMRRLTDQLMELAREIKTLASSVKEIPSAPQTSNKPAVSTTTKPAQAPTNKTDESKQVKQKQTQPTPKKQSQTKKTSRATTAAPTFPDAHASIPEQASPDQADDSSHPKRRGLTPSGIRTPEHTFILPILQTLETAGGEAETGSVLEGVLDRMRHILKPSDFETTQTSGQPRWKVSIYLARSIMVRQGLLRNDTPRGIWAISDLGRRYLADHSVVNGT